MEFENTFSNFSEHKFHRGGDQFQTYCIQILVKIDVPMEQFCRRISNLNR